MASLAFDTAAQHPSAAESVSADAAMAPELFSPTLTDVTLPNTNARLDHSVAHLTQDLSYTGVSTIVHTADLRVDGNQSVGVPRPRTNSISAPTTERWTLHWNLNDEYVVGYIVYFGNTPAITTRRLATVSLATLANPSAPSVSSMTTSELNLSPGMRGCFRLKGRNEAERSAF